MYDGGMGELGVGRGGMQLLASIFHPDGPTTWRRRYNGPDPPEGLPTSLLTPRRRQRAFAERT